MTRERPGLRREDARLLTGQAQYLADIQLPGLLRCSYARTSVAHGRLTRVSVEAARAAPGVVGAFTAGDLDLADIPSATGEGPEASGMTRPPLARERVRYAGEAVAVVVAETGHAAADALELVEFEIDPEPVVMDPRAALEDETVLFPEAGSNVVVRVSHTEPPGAPGVSRWPVSATVEVDNQRLAPVPIEALGVLVDPDPSGALKVWCGHQAPHRLRRQLARLLALDEDQIRVIVPDTGGGFGLRGMLFPEYVVTAAIARKLGRPVAWHQTRSEQFLCGTHGRGQRHRVTLAGDRDGRIQAAELDIVADVGAYPHNGSQVPMFTSYMATGAYVIPQVSVTTTMVVTNRAPTGSYRGAGRPEAAYAIEHAIEAFAHAAGKDSIAVRRLNLVPREVMPYRTPTGALYDSGRYEEALDLALELVDADAVREEQRRRQEARENPVGLGIGMFVERAGGAPDSTEYARVELDEHGGVEVRVGTASTGQGHETVWAQLVAERLQVEADTVKVITGDTGAVRDGVGSFASRSAQIGGSAIHRTAGEVATRLRAVAAGLLEVQPEDLELFHGGCRVLGDPGTWVPFKELVGHARAAGVDLAAEESYSPQAQTFPYGTAAAVVEVDLQTGLVTLRELVAVDDCGNVLNPQVVEGQVHGSLAQGIAQALYEGIEYDENGQLLTSTLVDYLVPSAADVPAVVTGRLVTAAPSNPLGAKGTGESGCIGAPPAIVNAALDALEPYGVTQLDMPLTPQRVWRALQSAQAGR